MREASMKMRTRLSKKKTRIGTTIMMMRMMIMVMKEVGDEVEVVEASRAR